MIVRKVQRDPKQLRGVFNASRSTVTDRPVSLPKVGGPTLQEIEAKYGPIKPHGQRS